MAASKALVKFHDVSDAYGAFSPLSPHPLTVRHVVYQTLHHFALCERFKDSPFENEIRTAGSLWEVERIVRKADSQGFQRPEWDRVKADVMLLGCYYKFRQNAEAGNLLQSTGAKTILFSSPDDFWGDGNEGSGKNLLGVTLMAVRKRLAQEDRTKKREAAQAASMAASTKASEPPPMFTPASQRSSSNKKK